LLKTLWKLLAMKVGDLILTRQAWVRDPYDDTTGPRLDDEGWSEPILIVERYLPPDESLYVGLDGDGVLIVVSESPGLTDVKVISER
jgi:hypothetical protein